MTRFRIGSFNVQNLIGPDREYYRFEQYTPTEYRTKIGWLAGQLQRMDADIVGFQEIFEKDALHDVLRAAGEGDAAVAFAPNLSDGGPSDRKPGLAVLSRTGFAAAPETVQDMVPPVDMAFHHPGGGDAGHFTLERLSRPVQKLRIPVGGRVVTLFNCHLKSRLGEYVRPHGARHSPEIDLVHYDALGRAMGFLRAGLRRMAEAWVVRRLILAEIAHGHPVIVTGDFNDSEGAVSSEILRGETPMPDYTDLRRAGARAAADFHTDDEAARIRAQIEAVLLHSAETIAPPNAPDRDTRTTAFGSLDRILVSRHFHPDFPDRLGEVEDFFAFNAHILDQPQAETSMMSDHGQIVAQIRLRDPVS